MVRMAQEWQGSNARRRSLESAMKETQARTKVVLRHLPPTLSNAAFQEQIAAKFAGSYTLCSFHPGKTSHKHQVHSRAYINFKKPEDVIDFYEDFNGHVFVNERGAQYRAVVEYAPYQRVPKPRSKKDVREGTIMKDPEYMAFVEHLAKPTEYLPSAEVQLERREAEKAASLASGGSKDSVIVTPLMEFVRLRRAAKSAPQRGMSSSAKVAARSANQTAAAYNLSSQKRASDKNRPGSTLYVTDNTSTSKEVSNLGSGPRREEQQRRERANLLEQKRKETAEGKEKKSAREAGAVAPSSSRTTPGSPRVESNKERTILLMKEPSEAAPVQVTTADGEQSGLRPIVLGKSPSTVALSGETAAPGDGRDMNKREIKRKQVVLAKDKELTTEPGQVLPASNSGGGTSNQRHRSPASAKSTVGLGNQQQSYRATSPGDSVSTPKQGHRRESGGRTSARGIVSQSQLQSVQGTLVGAVAEDSQTQQVQSPQERGGKRPPRPQTIRLLVKDQPVSLVPSADVDSEAGHINDKTTKQIQGEGVPLSVSERHDPRRLRNKDRPDRPVWTPRRRDGGTVGADGTVVSNGVTSPVSAPISETSLGTTAQSGTDMALKNDKGERWSHGRHTGRAGTESRGSDNHQAPGPGAVGSSGNTPSSKARHAEAGGRSGRGGRATGDLQATGQADGKNETVVSDAKIQGSKQARENGDSNVQGYAVSQQLITEDRRKLDITLNESVGGHKQGGRRDRNGHQGLKDGEGGLMGVDLASKLAKRGRGPLQLGSNEKQVWVAVQKTVTGS